MRCPEDIFLTPFARTQKATKITAPAGINYSPEPITRATSSNIRISKWSHGVSEECLIRPSGYATFAQTRSA